MVDLPRPCQHAPASRFRCGIISILCIAICSLRVNRGPWCCFFGGWGLASSAWHINQMGPPYRSDVWARAQSSVRWWSVVGLGEEGGVRFSQVNRDALRQALSNRLQRGTIQFSSHFRNLETAHGQLVLQFEDGTSKTADVVVACDGLRSRTRMYGQDAWIARAASQSCHPAPT